MADSGPRRVLVLEIDRHASQELEVALARAGLGLESERVDDLTRWDGTPGGPEPALILAVCARASDAWEALDAARQRRPGLPFIIVAAGADEDLELQSLERGACDVVVLERPGRLGPAVRRALQEARERRELLLAREALQKRQAEFHALIENVSSGVALVDNHGQFTLYNRQFLSMFGLGAESNISNVNNRDWSAWQVFDEHGRLLEVDEHPVRKASLTGKTVLNQLVGVRRPSDGELLWMLVSAAPLFGENGIEHLICTYHDVTERKRSEEALLDSERRFRQLADAMPQLVWTAEPEGRVDYYNQRLTEFSGIRRDRDGTWLWEPVLHPDDLAASLEAWSNALRSGTTYEIAHRVKRADGSYRWYLSRGIPARAADGRIVKWFGTATDIHEQKEAEARLVQADHRKSDFLAVLSHELRNPLAPIRNSAFILSHTGIGGAQAGHALEVIQRQVQHMTRLIDDLLDVTRISRGKIRLQNEPLELGLLVRSTAEDHRSVFASSGVEFELQCCEGTVPVRGDRTRLSQVIGNLLHNAAKFTPRGGRVALSLEAHDGQAWIGVRDNGAGIAANLLDKLFEPFMQAQQTLERSKGGLGLGLSLVKALVEMHGGTVWARSDGPGTGAEFVVRLPLQQATDSEPAVSPMPSPARQQHRVLIIEDNVDAAESLRDVLELEGHEVEVAFTGPEGLSKASGMLPDVILCDIGLPGMDGFEVARSLREDTRLQQPFLVALTGYALQEDIEKAKLAGFDRHMAKPPEMHALQRLLGSLSR